MSADGRASQVMDREEWMRRTGPLYPPLVAVKLLTRAPVLRGVEPSADDMARAAVWFPMVGAVVGAMLAAIAALVLETDLVAAIIAVLVLATALLITGAMHESALAVTADRIGSQEEGATDYERYGGKVGFYGLLAVIALLAVRLIFMLGIKPGEWTGALIASQVAMRWGPLLLLCIGDRLEEPYRARTLSVGPVSWAVFGVGSVFAMVASVLFGGAVALLALLIAALAAFGLGLMFQRREGGLTSDSLAATSVVCEVTVLVCFAAAHPAHVSPWAS